MKLISEALFLLLVVVFSVKSQGTINSTMYENIDLNRLAEVHQRALTDFYEELKGESASCRRFIESLQSKQNTTSNLAWLIQMLDAQPKLPSGLLVGNLNDYGSYDECVDIDSGGVQGQYCAMAVTYPIPILNTNESLPLMMAVCIPDSCSFPNKNTSFANYTNTACHTKGPYQKFDWDDWVVAGVFIVILLLILFCTVYDAMLHMLGGIEPRSPLFIAFSLITNGRKLFATSSAPGQIQCLNGMRAFSMMWVIAGHRYVSQLGIPQINLFRAIEFKTNLESAYISSGRACVDTFFMLSAFLLSYGYFKRVKSAVAKAVDGKKPPNPLPFSGIPMYVIHRVLRLTPALAAVFFVQLTLIRRIADGPLWTVVMEMFRDNCLNWWWSFWLYVQNYVNYRNMCIVPTWYLSADMQMFLLAPFLIIPLGELRLRGRKAAAYITLFVTIGIAILVPMIVDFNREFIIDNIYETHTRLSVYIIGLLFGMFVIDCSDRKLPAAMRNPIVNVAAWGLSLGVMMAIILTMHDTEIYPEKLKNNLFFTFTRPAWTLSLCWIIFSCHFGMGGPVNWLLSLPIFQVMNRLSYSMYLLHNPVITITLSYARTSTYFSEYMTMYYWSGDFIFTLVLSIIWVLCFESPVVCIEKVIFGGAGGSKRPAVTKKPVEEDEAPKTNTA